MCFSISTIWTNYHTCCLDGKATAVRKHEYIYVQDECYINFIFRKNKVEVNVTGLNRWRGHVCKSAGCGTNAAIDSATYVEANKNSHNQAPQDRREASHASRRACALTSQGDGIMAGKMVMFYLFALIGILLIPSVIFAASFDCSKATSELEKIICGDDELSKLDESLSKAYLQALEWRDIKNRTIKSQRQWLKVRNACKDAECLKNAYETRIKELGLSEHGIAILTAPNPSAPPLKLRQRHQNRRQRSHLLKLTKQKPSNRQSLHLSGRRNPQSTSQ